MQFNKILSAGCSFIQGNELGDEFPFSHSTYPALLAKHFNVAYASLAYAGASNQGIVKKLFDHTDYRDTLVIVQWTYPSRIGINLSYEYADKNNHKQQWFDLAPDNWDLKDIFNDSQSYTKCLKDFGIDDLSKQVYMHFGNDNHFDFQTKLCIHATVNFLSAQNIPFIFFCTTSLDETNKFENLGFVEWAKQKKFKHGKYNHPLHDAHKSACKYILDNNLITKSQQH